MMQHHRRSQYIRSSSSQHKQDVARHAFIPGAVRRPGRRRRLPAPSPVAGGGDRRPGPRAADEPLGSAVHSWWVLRAVTEMSRIEFESHLIVRTA
jgi:hypothetical protein